MRTLLVNLPFASPNRPSLALCQLRTVLLQEGRSAEVLHANLDFAREIGIPLYAKIAEKYPQELLLGELVFSPFVAGDASPERLAFDHTFSTARHSAARTSGSRAAKLAVVPEEFWELMPLLREHAWGFLQRTRDRVLRDRPDVLGLNLTFQAAPSLALARLVKRAAPEVVVVAGGAQCEDRAGLALHRRFDQLDFVCRGEGEELLPALVRSLEDGTSHEDIPGLVWRDEGGSRFVAERSALVEDLDALPLPQFDDWMREVRDSRIPLELDELVLPFESSRGCWYGQKLHCTFCGLYAGGMGFRAKSPARVVEQVRDLARHGVPNADAADLILARNFHSELLPALANLSHGLSIFYEVKSNLRRDQLLAMKAAGIVAFQPGIESLSSSVLQLMRKGVQAFQNVRLLKWAVELDLDLHWNILFGFPSEDPEEYASMSELVRRIMHLQPPRTGCTPVVLSRFSPLFYDAERLGVREIRPAPAYWVVYEEFPDVVADVAYFHDFDCEPPARPEEYVEPLRAAVDAWQSRAPRSRLDYEDDGVELSVTDTRPIAKVSADSLSGLARRVLLACDDGVTREALGKAVEAPPEKTSSVLAELVERNWIIELDRRLLSIVVARPGRAARAGLPEAGSG
jgi:ribosomal peptide maturation radical SAM protein 1